MKKKIVSIILSVFLLFSVPLGTAAYEPTGLTITAKSGLLASIDTKEILYSKNIDDKMYPASLTKIMTVTLILENPAFDPAGTVTMTKEVQKLISGTGSAVSNVSIDEQITGLDLIYLILMASYGDCSYLGAITYGGNVDSFVAQMNAKAAELGLTGTHYGNPVGLHDEDTYTTVRDVYTLTSYALQNQTFKTVCESARYQMPATNKSGPRTLSTTNFLQDNTTNYYYSYAKGVKTGFTDEAGRCLVSTASYNGYNYLCILMNCPSSPSTRYEFSESRELYRWAFKNFEFKQVADSQNPVCEIPVELSLDTDFVPLYIENGFLSVLPVDADMSTIVIKTHPNSDRVDAPIEKGQVLGTADIVYAEQVLGTVNLVAGSSVEASRLLIAARAVKGVLTSDYMKLVYILAVAAILIFIILVIRLNAGRGKRRKVKYIPYDERKEKNNHEN